MRGPLNLQIWMEHQKDLLREAEATRMARKARGTRKQRSPSLISALWWELQRYGGLAIKLLVTLKHHN